MIPKGNKTQEQEKTLAYILEAKRKAAEEATEQSGTGLKILTSKQVLQRLPIALAQVNTGNNSESLLTEIKQTICSLYQSKEITKTVYNNMIGSIQLQKWILYL